jgi:hypothetical protein
VNIFLSAEFRIKAFLIKTKVRHLEIRDMTSIMVYLKLRPPFSRSKDREMSVSSVSSPHTSDLVCRNIKSYRKRTITQTPEMVMMLIRPY